MDTMIEMSTPSALPLYVAWSASISARLLCARGDARAWLVARGLLGVA